MEEQIKQKLFRTVYLTKCRYHDAYEANENLLRIADQRDFLRYKYSEMMDDLGEIVCFNDGALTECMSILRVLGLEDEYHKYERLRNCEVEGSEKHD